MIVKKAPDKESKKLSPMAREQVQNTSKKLGPLETLKRAQLEEMMTTDRVCGQQKEHNQNNADMAKTREGTADV